MTRDRAVEALDELRAQPVEPPAPAFADALEHRLRDEHPGRGGAAPVRGAPRERRRRPVAAVAAVAAVVIVIGLALAALPDGADGRVVLTAARDTSIVLPNGQVVQATAGLELADGTIIVTGEEGAAEVDGVAIGSSRVAVIVGDGVVVLDPAAGGPLASDDPVATTTRAPGAPTTAPPPTRPPSETTTTTRPASTTTTVARSNVDELTLAAERVGRTVVAVRWSGYTGPDFDRYVVVRTLGDGGPATTVFTSRSASTVAFRDEVPPGTTAAGYRVLVLDRTGEVVAASPLTRV